MDKKQELWGIEDKVRCLLETNPRLRGDDYALYAEYVNRDDPEAASESFYTLFNSHKEFGLPSFEGVTRARRRLQAEHPELRPRTEVYMERLNLQQEYISFGIGE